MTRFLLENKNETTYFSILRYRNNLLLFVSKLFVFYRLTLPVIDIIYTILYIL